MSEETFPIMGHWNKKAHRQEAGFEIPLSMISPHERQAKANHYQSLKRLADRGGLAPCEALAVLDDRNWKEMDPEESRSELMKRLEDYLK